jgi:hypothetical protein
MDEALRLFDSLTGTLCGSCTWIDVCGAAGSEHACRSITRTAQECGPGVLHPSDPATHRYLRSVGGPRFDTITAEPVAAADLPGYLPQIRTRSALIGALNESVYAVRADVVIGQRAHVLSAADLKTRVGLRPVQKLVLLLFGQDRVLERLWNDSPTLLREIATAGFDLVVAPSYSTWTPRPRTEHLYNLKRSLVFFQALRQLGASAVPRLAWVTEHDVRRCAAWLLANPAVEFVGLDWTTYRADSDWRAQIEGLGLLDRLTGRRLRYLINGPTTSNRCADVFIKVRPTRVCLTSSTLGPPPPERNDQLPLSAGERSTATFEDRCAARRRVIAEGERIAWARTGTRDRRALVKYSRGAEHVDHRHRQPSNRYWGR